MHLNNLKIIAALLDLKVSSLRVYIANDYFPYVKLGNRVFVTNETLENLKWMKEQGLPLSQYNGMNGKPFKDGRGSMTEWNEFNNRKLVSERSSGMGDNRSDSTTDVYDAPKELIIWGEDQTTMSIPQLRKKVSSLLEELQVYEDALRDKDKGYTGRTIVPSAPGLVGELQETIAEQERQIERFEKFIKKHSPLLAQEMQNQKRGLAILQDADAEALDNIVKMGDKVTPEMLEEAIRLQNKPR
jgi:hypothetical protein